MNSTIFVSESEGGSPLSSEAAFASVGGSIPGGYITGNMPYFNVSSIGVPLVAFIDMETGTIVASELDGGGISTSQMLDMAAAADAD